MTLRALSDYLKIPTSDTPHAKSNDALVFVFNSDFTKGAHVLWYSMIVQKTLLDNPILVLSNEEEVLNDPLVKLASDKSILVTDTDIEKFSKISSSKVEAKLRLEWIPKYTFLKWMMYQDYGYDKHIFIDADMLCLQPLDELTALDEGDFVAAPVFDLENISRNGSFEKNLMSFVEDQRPKTTRVNTGLTVVNKKCMTSSFFEELLRFASDHAFPNEQKAVREFVLSKPDLQLSTISPSYNFHYNYICRAVPTAQLDLISKVKILHYVGGKAKPWQHDRWDSIPHALWHSFAMRLAEHLTATTESAHTAQGEK